MPNSEPFRLSETDGVLSGPVRRPANASKLAAGSIHDEATAQRLGFRGGTVAANIHFEQFPPLLEAALGAAFARTGGLSLYFLTPTTDGEPVQAFARLEAPGHWADWRRRQVAAVLGLPAQRRTWAEALARLQAGR